MKYDRKNKPCPSDLAEHLRKSQPADNWDSSGTQLLSWVTFSPASCLGKGQSYYSRILSKPPTCCSLRYFCARARVVIVKPPDRPYFVHLLSEVLQTDLTHKQNPAATAARAHSPLWSKE